MSQDRDCLFGMRRFLFSGTVTESARAVLRGAEARHLRHVLRLQPGEEIVLVTGAGRQFTAVIEAFEGEEVRLRVTGSKDAPGESGLRITLAQGFLKEKKMDKLVRSLTELGVSRFVPVICSRSLARPSGNRMKARTERWQRISRQSIKQCRRLRSLEIMPLMEFGEALGCAESDRLKLFFWEEQNLSPLPPPLETAPSSVFMLLGPEGGFTAREAQMAREAGFTVAGLGPRILRAETATLAAVVLAQYLWGDMGQNLLDNQRPL